MRKIRYYISRMMLINKIRQINREDGSEIYWKTNIDKDTFFEGKNKVGRRCSLCGSFMGRMSYMADDCLFPHAKIGRYCSMAGNIRVVAGRHPSSQFVSTHDIFYSAGGYLGKGYYDEDIFEQVRLVDGKWNVVIGNDVWIGNNVLILGGVMIGDGAIIAAGAVVTKDIPPFSVNGGVPARVIKYRFTEEEIQRLEEIKWWDRGEVWIDKNREAFADIETFLINLSGKVHHE